MKYYLLIVISFFILSCAGNSSSLALQPADISCKDSLTVREVVNSLIARISSRTMSQCIEDLTSIPSRKTHEPGCIVARDYLIDQLDEIGWNVSTTTFMVGNTKAYNIIAEKKGVDSSDKAIVISAHYDSWNGGNAGANDNASGCAGLVAIAKSLDGMNISFHHTIRLIAFSAEEQGARGSADYVRSINPNSILAVINLDGIAPKTIEQTSILISYKKPYSNWLVDDFYRISKQYSDSTGFNNIYEYNNHRWGTDTDPFWNNNISGIWILGNGEFPYANTLQDTFDKVDPVYGSRLVKTVAAVAFTLAEPLGVIL